MTAVPVNPALLCGLPTMKGTMHICIHCFWTEAVYLCICGNVRILSGLLVTVALCAGTLDPNVDVSKMCNKRINP